MSKIIVTGAGFADLAMNVLGGDHSLCFRANGGSMWPFIRDGDVLEVQPLRNGQVNLGDILLTVRTDGQPVAHRVVKIGQDNCQNAFWTQGDANLFTDGVICSGQVLGRVVAFSRNGRRLSVDNVIYPSLRRLWIASIPIREHLLKVFTLGARIRGSISKILDS